MFCSSCGAECNQKTKFCTSCGASTNQHNTAEINIPKLPIERMIWAIVIFGLTGLAVSWSMLYMASGQYEHLPLIASIVSFLFTCCFTFLLVRQLGHLISAHRDNVRQLVKKEQIESYQSVQLIPPIQQQSYLPATQELYSSITESTTRSLSPLLENGGEQQNRR
jgi:hypothetical protein